MKKIIPIVVVALIIGGVFAYMQYHKPHRDIAAESSDFTLTANELFDAFDENENLANEMYLDKVIEVSGTLIDINKDQNASVVYTLEAENAMIGGLLCTMNEFKEEFFLEMNTNITLKCRCTGFLEDVILVDCSIKK